MKKLRIAIIGIAHIHVDYMLYFFGLHKDMYEIVGCADYPPYTKEDFELHKELNVNPRWNCTVFDDYLELLKKGIDVAVICTDIKDHARAACEMLGMNIHTIVEKPMSLTMADAKAMYAAAKKSKAELIINWPIAWFPTFNKVKELADAGKAGEILRVQYRSPATTGPYEPGSMDEEKMKKLWWYKRELGGGAICDYTCYGCVLATWITGKTAKSVNGMRTNTFLKFSDVEDYSLFVMDFDGCIGLAEGSWATISDGQIATGPVVYGTKGVIVGDRRDPEVKVYTTPVWHTQTLDPDEVYKCCGMDDDLPKNVYEHLVNSKPLHELLTLDFNMKAQAAFDAGIRSCDSGNTEKTESFTLE